MAWRTKRLIWLLGTASCLVMGEGMPVGAEGAGSAGIPERSADLDFADDFPLPKKSARRFHQAPKRAAALPIAPILEPEPASRAWIYWALGLSAAAAGGTAWILHGALVEPVEPNRKTEVFTDDPD